MDASWDFFFPLYRLFHIELGEGIKILRYLAAEIKGGFYRQLIIILNPDEGSKMFMTINVRFSYESQNIIKHLNNHINFMYSRCCLFYVVTAYVHEGNVSKANLIKTN